LKEIKTEVALVRASKRKQGQAFRSELKEKDLKLKAEKVKVGPPNHGQTDLSNHGQAYQYA
jgi:hypothetical protein